MCRFSDKEWQVLSSSTDVNMCQQAWVNGCSSVRCEEFTGTECDKIFSVSRLNSELTNKEDFYQVLLES